MLGLRKQHQVGPPGPACGGGGGGGPGLTAGGVAGGSEAGRAPGRAAGAARVAAAERQVTRSPDGETAAGRRVPGARWSPSWSRGALGLGRPDVRAPPRPLNSKGGFDTLCRPALSLSPGLEARCGVSPAQPCSRADSPCPLPAAGPGVGSQSPSTENSALAGPPHPQKELGGSAPAVPPRGWPGQALQETLVVLPRATGSATGRSPQEWALDRPCRDEDGGPPRVGGVPRGLPLKHSLPPPLPALVTPAAEPLRLTRGVSACPAGGPSPTDPRGLRQLAGLSPVGPLPPLSSCLGASCLPCTRASPLCLVLELARRGYTPVPLA